MDSPTKSNYSTIIATGLAIFSMFFGAGNVVVPLALGQYAQDKAFIGIIGLLITAVGVPLAGVMAMTLFNGNYKDFFARIGKVPGFILALFIMGLIGPFGVIPRCITLSYSTIKMYTPGISLPVFSILSCILIFVFTFKKNRILDLLGYVLTPLLLLCLGIIIVKGLIVSPSAPIADHSHVTYFVHGLKEGYQTMDLLGAFFFSGVVLACLRKDDVPATEGNYKQLIKMTLQASCIGAFLLAIIYVGFSYVASFYSETLSVYKPDELLGALAREILGPSAGIIASIAVALACLTTAIAISSVFAEFLFKEVFREKVSYIASLIITLVAGFFISTLSFTGIMKFLVPILQVCYPALIVLSILNIAFKLYKFKPVKRAVAATFALSLIMYFV